MQYVSWDWPYQKQVSDLEENGRKLLDAAIEEWVIGKNGERDRIIMRMHLFDGPTHDQMQKRLEKIGREIDDPTYDLSIDRIKKIILIRENQIQRHINPKDIGAG